MGMTDEIRATIIRIAQVGSTNMFQTETVKVIAVCCGHPEVARYIDENPLGYCNFIMFGDENTGRL